MNSLEFAGLGCCRGAGESLSSWLRAGPLGSNAVASLDSPAPTRGALREGELYCPACRLEELGRRRWYSRIEWKDPRCVICSVHAVPLVQCDAPPTRLRGRLWPQALRIEFRALNLWTRGWSESVSSREGDRANQPEVAVLRAILARTDPRLPYSRALAEGQWRLWVEGWPVPAGPLYPAQRRAMPARQSDRLAVWATTHRVCLGLQTGVAPNWPPLHIRSRTLARLRGHLHPLNATWNEHISQWFTREA